MRGRLLYAALLLLAPLLLLGPTLLRGDRFLPLIPAALEPIASELPAEALAARDNSNWVQSDRLFPVLTDQRAMRAALSNGEVPLWAPELGVGLPLAAGSIAGPLYPPNALALAMKPEDSAGPLALLTLILSGLGLWLFLGRIGVARGPRLVAILALQLGSWAVGNLYYPMKVDAALWVPYSLWAVEGLARGRRGAGAALSLATAASLLAGFPTVAVFGVFLVALYGLVRLTPLAAWLSPSLDDDFDAVDGAPPPVLPPLLAAGIAGILGIGLSMLQLLPTLEASSQSKRATINIEQIEAQALPTAATLGLVLHDLVATPTDQTPPGRHAVAWWLTPREHFERADIANQLEWNMFVGVGVVVLALVGLIAGGRRARFPGVALLVVIGYACAWPVLRWAYALPGLSVGAPGRILSMAWFLWPWMAGLGVQAIVDNASRARAALLGLAGFATLVLGGWALLFSPADWAHSFEDEMVERYNDPPLFIETAESIRLRIPAEDQLRQAENLQKSIRFAGLSSLSLLCAALLALWLSRKAPHLVWAPLAAMILLEGLFAAEGHVTGMPDDAGVTFPETESVLAMREAAGDGRILRLDTSLSGKDDVGNLARPNLPHAYGLGDLTPYAVFTPLKLIELFQCIEPSVYDTPYLTFNATLRRVEDLDHPILDLARATAILSRNPIEHPRLVPVLERPGFNVYRRTNCFAPARMCRIASPVASDEAALLGLARPVYDVSTISVLAKEHGEISLPLYGPDWIPGEIELTRPASGVVEIKVTGTTGGLLVVHDQWYPGWQATVDGESVDILRADHAFRGVVLTDGDHLVRMEYHPSSARIGFLISLLSLVFVVFLTRRPS
ncbi:MAG: hypothetical protein ACI8PQ_002441 [Planctomycetota bacterium]|jgi:hypothetical protein